MFRGKGWFGGGLWRPKNPHSLEHLKYLYNVLYKNQIVNEHNKGLLVETLRSIAEILIWGDQNDSTVFDFFLEKNMLSFFLRIMKQKCGRYVCIQLLQTLNILFENIRNETSLYYLLSNNHVNSIIVHKFDFSDEEVMAYYISFLKTLSLKLNPHTIHFFYNEHTNDFPLYTEAIKFFNHTESMVRIAVRTLTLNVYKVDDKSMLKFIRDKTAAPYFSNLVWFIGNHVLELDACVREDADHQSRNRLADLVAEHLDHLHYLHDILCLRIDALNDVLADHLLNRLFIPLYVFSLTKKHRKRPQDKDSRPHISSSVSLFLLSQVFLIISYEPLVHYLADIILNGNFNVFADEIQSGDSSQGQMLWRPGFIAPSESLEQSLDSKLQRLNLSQGSKCGNDVNTWSSTMNKINKDDIVTEEESITEVKSESDQQAGIEEASDACDEPSLTNSNITDEEKERQMEHHQYIMIAHNFRTPLDSQDEEFTLANRPYLEAVFDTLDCADNDYTTLFSLCLLYAIGHNEGTSQDLLDSAIIPSDKSEGVQRYNSNLIERLIKIISQSCQCHSKVRLATLEMSLTLLKQMVFCKGYSYLQDKHLAALEGAREESTLLLRNFYKSEEIFLDMFEDEYREIRKRPLNVEYLLMDSNILLQPTGTPLTGIEFSKRLPCGEVERARKAIRVFFLLRDLSLTLRNEQETHLPLTDPNNCIQVGEVLDLNNSDLIACTVITKDSQKIRRFLVIDVLQLILVEPDSRRLGWGITKFVGFLQDIEVSGDKDDSRCLHVTIHRPLSSATPNRIPLLSAKFVFDDHIRCMAAKQRLTKGRLKARQRKMHQIAKLLELPSHIQPCPSPPSHTIHTLRHPDGLRRGSTPQRGVLLDGTGRGRPSMPYGHKPLFVTNTKVPGFATVLLKEDSGGSFVSSQHNDSDETFPRRHSSSPTNNGARARDSSPRNRKAEEIPLDVLYQVHVRGNVSPRMRKSSTSPPQGFTCSSTSEPVTGQTRRNISGVVPSLGKHQTSDIEIKDEKEIETIQWENGKSADTAPKTLRLAEAPTVSLIDSTPFATPCTPNALPAPCILPPCESASLTSGFLQFPPPVVCEAQSSSNEDFVSATDSSFDTPTRSLSLDDCTNQIIEKETSFTTNDLTPDVNTILEESVTPRRKSASDAQKNKPRNIVLDV